MTDPRLRALIVDDERLARKRLRELLSRHPEVEIVGEADDLETARAAAETLRPDVLFLDVDLSPGNGFDLLPRLSFQPATVFVTAHDTFAVQAFEVHALDYLLKPISPARLAASLARLLEEKNPGDNPADRQGMSDQLTLKDAGTIRIVEVRRIVAIKAEGAYSRVLLHDAPPATILRGISEWERLLPEPDFARLDRSLIVQLPRVQAVESVSRDQTWITLTGLPNRLCVGRVASLRLRRLLASPPDDPGLPRP